MEIKMKKLLIVGLFLVGSTTCAPKKALTLKQQEQRRSNLKE
jgi:hypothetical protein